MKQGESQVKAGGHRASEVSTKGNPLYSMTMFNASKKSIFFHALSFLCVATIAAAALLLAPQYADATTVYLTSGSSWTVPSDWGNSGAVIEVVGGGGGGSAGAGAAVAGLVILATPFRNNRPIRTLSRGHCVTAFLRQVRVRGFFHAHLFTAYP